MQGKANPLSWGGGLTIIDPRPGFSSCSPYSQVSPDPPPSTFPKAGSPELGNTSLSHLEDDNGCLQGSVF